MQIKYYGHACFSIEDKENTVITDPYSDEIGLKLPSLSASIVTVSHDNKPYNNVSSISGEPMILNWPGEYERGGIHFKGVNSFHNTKDDTEQLPNTVFIIDTNNIRLCHLGAQGAKLTSEQLESIGDVDILFVPVGGKGHSIDAKKAKEVIEQIEPRVVIPMMYHTDGSNLGLGSLEDFLSIMGANAIEPVNVFAVKRSELPEDNSKVVLLRPTV